MSRRIASDANPKTLTSIVVQKRQSRGSHRGLRIRQEPHFDETPPLFERRRELPPVARYEKQTRKLERVADRALQRLLGDRNEGRVE